jgi:hypothetical protein
MEATLARRKLQEKPTPGINSSGGEKTLGLDQEITRRDFLNSTLLGSGALLLTPLSPAQLLAQNAPTVAAIDDWTG